MNFRLHNHRCFYRDKAKDPLLTLPLVASYEGPGQWLMYSYTPLTGWTNIIITAIIIIIKDSHSY